MESFFNVIVIGAGHAGTEAAFAAAKSGSKVLVITTNLDFIASMPCNPSMGGPGKGHLIREIHAMGGQIADNIENTYLQIRELNESKGPAVRALRAQCDKYLYHLYVKKKLESFSGISLFQDEVVSILYEKDSKNKPVIHGVKTKTGLQFSAPAVILSTGTFLCGKIIVGETIYEGGPSGQIAANELSSNLKLLGVKLKRLQTATPPRINARSINFDGLKTLDGNTDIKSFCGNKIKKDQRPCFLTYTNEKTVAAVKENLHYSPLKLGNITQSGPHHCPSIDRKIIRFPDQIIHQIFIEPESDYYNEYYLQGLTTALPAEVQTKIIHSVKGLEEAEIIRFGYAIEYDAISAVQLKKSLEFKAIEGLFACGQICGTSGYEEAAAQGLIAGINAHLKARKAAPFVLKRSSSFLACLIDELVTHERNDPLRVTTSLSEFRLHLRSDNAEERLYPVAFNLGMIDKKSYFSQMEQQKIMDMEIEKLQSSFLRPNKKNLALLKEIGTDPINNPVPFSDLLSRNDLSYLDLSVFGYDCIKDREIITKIEIQLKYALFLDKIKIAMQKSDELDEFVIPENFNFCLVPGIDQALALFLNELKPYSLGQITRLKQMRTAYIGIIQKMIKTQRLI
jgi:tRNA uridine 5-carboxymethylaminomethyl modification enzyme